MNTENGRKLLRIIGYIKGFSHNASRSQEIFAKKVQIRPAIFKLSSASYGVPVKFFFWGFAFLQIRKLKNCVFTILKTL
jgi:hypothetical protein